MKQGSEDDTSVACSTSVFRRLLSSIFSRFRLKLLCFIILWNLVISEQSDNVTLFKRSVVTLLGIILRISHVRVRYNFELELLVQTPGLSFVFFSLTERLFFQLLLEWSYFKDSLQEKHTSHVASRVPLIVDPNIFLKHKIN